MEDVKGARWPLIAITVLRVFVGWHFLYEGLAKLTSPSWSAAGYMKQARGPFAELFRWLAVFPNGFELDADRPQAWRYRTLVATEASAASSFPAPTPA